MSRRKGRVLVFQGLYSWDVGGSTLEDILTFSWVEAEDVEAQAFASLVIPGVIEHIDVINSTISSHLSANWSIDRLNKVTLAILRMGVYELMFQSDSPSKVVIDEAVEISKKYGEDGSFRFINAVLDKISKEQ